MDNLNWELVVCKNYRIESELVTVVEMYFVISSLLKYTILHTIFFLFAVWKKTMMQLKLSAV